MDRKAIIIVAVVLVIAAAVWFGMTYFDVDAQGEFEAPRVEVEGGQVPDVDVRGPSVRTGTETVEVPTIDIDPPADNDNENPNQ